jgi:hypothetical protein
MTSVEDTLRIRYKVQEDTKKKNAARECIEGPPKTLDKQQVQPAPVMRSISGPDLLALSYKADVGFQMLADMHHEGLTATS